MPESLAEIVLSLTQEGKKVTAVKTVRQQTGWSLREAKTYVDRLVSDRPYAHPHVSETEITKSVRAMLRSRGKIAAIKLLRKEKGWGLKQAKDFVDQLAKND